MLQAMPLLDDLAREPARAASLSRESRNLLLSRCAAILAALSALDEPASDERGGAADPERDRMLTVPEVAELLGFARGYTYELLRRGEIRALHHGKYWRISPTAVAEFIRSHEGRGELARSVNGMLGRITDRAASAGGARTPRLAASHDGPRPATLAR
jgi:excisionase family DNA binding protein